ncbi:hypothetical protein IMSAGC021_01280 [Muribaculaceae bacterium]|nr:hypothetical protein IMSAGC021_01280 [Muribaculaceae bacterium]
MMDIRPFHDLCLQTLDVIHFHPEIGAHALRSFHALRVSEQHGIFPVVAVESRQCHLPVFCLCRDAARMIKSKGIGQFRFLLRHRDRPRAAVLQQFAVFNIRMSDSPVRKEAPCAVQRRRLHQQRRDRAVDIRLADNRDPFLVQQGICRAGHDTQFALQLVPALDRNGSAAVFLSQILHCHLQRRHILQFVIFDHDLHIFTAVSDNLFHFRLFFFYSLHLIRQLRHRDRRKLDIEFFKQFPFIAHGGPEIKRPCGNLKDADAAECLYHITYCHKVPYAPLKHRIIQTAVSHVGKGYAEPSEHLARRKQPALGIPEPYAVLVRPFIQRSPEQHRYVQLLCQPCALILRTEVAVGQEQPVDLLRLEFLRYFDPVIIVIEKPLFVDIRDIHKIYAHLP